MGVCFGSVIIEIRETTEIIYMVDSHESDAYRQKTTLLHNREFFSLYRRQVEQSQKKYASSLYIIVEHVWSSFSLLNTRVTLQIHYVICKCHNVIKFLVAKSTAVRVLTIRW